MPYCTQANIESVFGDTNVAKWADMDNDGSADSGRIDRAISVADAMIDDVCRLTGLKIPVQNAAGSTPTTIEELSANLAGVWLYEARGVMDFSEGGEPNHRLAWHRHNARRTLHQIRTGQIKLDAVIGGN